MEKGINLSGKGSIIAMGVFLLFLIPISLAANEFTLHPSTMQANVSARTPTNFTVIANNTFSFDIFNLTCNNFENVKFYPINKITAGQQGNLIFNVNASSAYDLNFVTPCNFKFLTDVPRQVKTININITDGLPVFSPNVINAYRNDVIIFKNTGSVTHTLTFTDGSLDQAISAGEQYSYTATSIGNKSFFDRTSSAGGSLNVLDNILKVPTSNDAYLKSLAIRIISIFTETSISVEVQPINFSISYNGEKEGVITIRNTGNGEARGIRLSATWLHFDENNFNLPSGELNLVTFKIRPSINKTADTNKTYTRSILIEGNNFASRNIAISMFIPFNRFASIGNGTSIVANLQDAIRLLNEFCRQNPISSFCKSTGNASIIYRDSNVLINVSTNEFLAMRNAVQNLTDNYVRLENIIKPLRDDVGGLRATVDNNTRFTVDLRDDVNTLSNTQAFSVGVLLIGAMGAGIYSHYQYARKKKT